MKKGIIFDLDGTLVDSVPDIATAFNQSLNNLNYDFNLDAKTIRTMVGGGVQTLIERAFDHVKKPLKKARLKELHDEFLVQYEPICCVESTLYPNVETTLKKLHQQKFHLGVCTNKPYDASKVILEGLNIAHYFKVCIGGDSYPVKKPDPRPLLGAIEQINCTPQDITYVGDSQVDYQAANAIAADFIFLSFGYNNGFEPPKNITVCNDFSEIPQFIS